LKKLLLKIVKRTLFTLLVLVVLLTLTVFLYMRLNKFGKSPEGSRQERISQSPNFKDGSFQNLSFTPQLTEGYTIPGIIYTRLFKKHEKLVPVDTIPSVKTDLLNLPAEKNILVWFGHSSYYMQLHGKRILVDPVFSGNASPLPGTVKAFAGTDRYTVEDLPAIDYLFISHDHYDHLDYETITKLKSKVGTVICGLGVGSHFEQWGYDSATVLERDWYESIEFDSVFTVHVTPARHFSGRGFSRNNTLWCSYVLETPSLKIYVGGDSGYDTHFAAIGKKFGPFDLAIIESGQYNEAWRYIHTLPYEVLQAAQDIKAHRLFPVHNSKFQLANHPWNEPLNRVSELNQTIGIPLVTPVIGELVELENETQQFKQWWFSLK
jgi:L-ascorbate metabolism protein UlaG (beta-lactamase superfamily)